MVNQISEVREIRKYKLSQQRCHVMKRERKKRKEFRKLLRDEMTIRIFIAGNLINKRIWYSKICKFNKIFMKRNNTKRCHEKIIFNNNERYRKISISFNLVIFTAIFSFSLSPIILVIFITFSYQHIVILFEDLKIIED